MRCARRGIIAGVIAAGAVCAVSAQTGGVQRMAREGVYTAQQAQRGAQAYARHCAECHGSTMKEDIGTAPLASTAFINEWKAYNAGDLFERMRQTMPKAAPGSLAAQEYADILAQILRVNGFPAGAMELAGRFELLKQIRFE
jgi:mono/diheme cytochrome c family protein